MPHLQKIPHLFFQIWLFTRILLCQLDSTHFLLEIRLDFLLMDPVLQKIKTIFHKFLHLHCNLVLSTISWALQINWKTFAEARLRFYVQCIKLIMLLQSVVNYNYKSFFLIKLEKHILILVEKLKLKKLKQKCEMLKVKDWSTSTKISMTKTI